MQKQIQHYETLSEGIEALKAQGFNLDFDVAEDGKMFALNYDTFFSAEDVTIEQIHRFEGMTAPSDSAILYALNTRFGAKGTMVDAYGVDGSSLKAEFLKKVSDNAK